MGSGRPKGPKCRERGPPGTGFHLALFDDLLYIKSESPDGRTSATRSKTVAVFDYDSNRFLECFFAVPMMGAVLQMVNWRLSADQILYTLNHAEAKTILINGDFLPILEAIGDKLEHAQSVVVIPEDGKAPETSVDYDALYEKVLADAPAAFDFPDLDEDNKATTFYTTGTTGDPKGVHFTHRQLVLHTFGVALAAGAYDTIGRFRSGDVCMPMTPMFHVHAWGLPYVATLLGTKQIYPGKYEPEMLLKLVVTEKVTFSHCVPTILQMLVASPAVKKVDLSRWKVIIGGSTLTRGLAKAARDLGITVYTGYGMSETCPVISLATPKTQMTDLDEDRLLELIVKTGLPLPLVEFEVVDEDGNPLPRDGVSTGEVVFRAPCQHEAVAESAAIGVPDEKWGERPLWLPDRKSTLRQPLHLPQTPPFFDGFRY